MEDLSLLPKGNLRLEGTDPTRTKRAFERTIAFGDREIFIRCDFRCDEGKGRTRGGQAADEKLPLPYLHVQANVF